MAFGINFRFIYHSCIICSFLEFRFLVINLINVGLGISSSTVPLVIVTHCKSEGRKTRLSCIKIQD